MKRAHDRAGRESGWMKTLFSEWTWPAWMLGGVLGYLAFGHGLPVWLGHLSESPAYALLVETGLHRPLAWMALAAGLVGSGIGLVADLRQRERQAMRVELDIAERDDASELEHWVCEAYRGRGCLVEARGLGDREGGTDLILREPDGRRVLLQYRHWQREDVSAICVREMYGLMIHHHADAVRIVALGAPTPEAALFAEGKPIEFMPAAELLQMIRRARVAGYTGPAMAGQDRASA